MGRRFGGVARCRRRGEEEVRVFAGVVREVALGQRDGSGARGGARVLAGPGRGEASRGVAVGRVGGGGQRSIGILPIILAKPAKPHAIAKSDALRCFGSPLRLAGAAAQASASKPDPNQRQRCEMRQPRAERASASVALGLARQGGKALKGRDRAVTRRERRRCVVPPLQGWMEMGSGTQGCVRLRLTAPWAISFRTFGAWEWATAGRGSGSG